MIKRLSIIIALTAIFSGCVAQWKGVTTQNNKVNQNGLALTLPDGWVTLKVNKELQITSFDGPSLNQISVETIKLKDMEKELKISIPTELDSLDASKQFIAYWSSKTGVSEFEVISNKFVESNGQPFFKVEWKFKDENGLTVRNVSQGYTKNGSLTHVAYSAPGIHYYDKSFSVYEDLCNNMVVAD